MAPVEKYVHQEYPKHVHKFGGLHLEVKNDAERDAALEAGWSLKPVLEEAKADAGAEPEVEAKPKGKQGKKVAE